MTFDQWLEQSEYNTVLLLDNAEEIVTAMKGAWQAGYDEGYEQGVEETMSK